jgi:hypothetical protein
MRSGLDHGGDAGNPARTPARAGQTGPNKNTGDLQWKFADNYNARPCADERKDAGAGTMGSNGKTMRRTMETMKKYNGVTASGRDAGAIAEP